MSTIRQHPEPMVLRMAHAIARYIGFGETGTISIRKDTTETTVARREVSPKPRLTIVQVAPEREEPQLQKWRRHPQLREYRPSISEDVRTARHEAVRGLCAARAGAADAAMNHFSIAARCDQVDLTALPGFWSLTRGKMQLVVEAYEQAGRYRDSAALDAHIATIFRPSLVGAKLQPIQPRENWDKAAST